MVIDHARDNRHYRTHSWQGAWPWKTWPRTARISIRQATGRSAGTPPGDNKVVDEFKVCRSPVSGIVIKIATQVGQSLQPGDVLFVLEAMKMETNITAPAAGKIAAIPVSKGISVQAGQVVVELE